MVGCAAETLGILALPTPVAVMGHSMSALCALFLTLAHPDRVSRLVLIGAPPGSGLATVRYRAMPFHWPPWNPDPWRMLSYGILLAITSFVRTVTVAGGVFAPGIWGS
jgi:pimeloyl-ACP methyl ester carboxylesterase